MDDLRLVKYDKTYFELSKLWLSDSELNYLVHAGKIPSEEERLVWYNTLAGRTDYLIWGVDYNGHPIGASGLKHIADKQAEYWGYIGDKTFWGRGLGKEMMKAVIYKATELNIEVIWLRVRKYNQRAINLYKKIGFIIDAEESETYHMTLSILNIN